VYLDLVGEVGERDERDRSVAAASEEGA
jgi:hypothetical protein